MKKTTLYKFSFLWLVLLILTCQNLWADPTPTFTQMRSPEGFSIWQTLFNHAFEPLSILLIQIIAILFIAKLFGFVFAYMGQPAVIGEILAGIFLGPTFLGTLFPEMNTFLFTKNTLGSLHGLSQIGLLLFMFIIGLEFDMQMLKKKARSAFFLSSTSILIPYSFGIILAYFIYQRFAPNGVSLLEFSLFMGIAMSITAFPVLARIVQERGISKSPIGILALTTAATGDVAAWGLLALVVAVVQSGSATHALWIALFTSIYFLIMVFIIKPLFKNVGEVYSHRENISRTVVAFAFLTLLISAWCTEIIGIHALFGAFVAGVIMPPSHDFRRILTEKIEDITLIILLPLFFVQTGLKTDFKVLFSSDLIGTTALICSIAIIGKYVGTTLAARFIKQSWKQSLILGALMNTRGLMELIVLDLGFQMGILSQEIFSALVFMAILTTLMTGPTLSLIDKIFKDKAVLFPDAHIKVLIAFGPAQMGRRLMNLAAHFNHTPPHQNMGVRAIHLTPNTDINTLDAQYYETTSFSPIRTVAEKHLIPLDCGYKASADITKEITTETHDQEYDLLLIGQAKSFFSSQVAGGKVKDILRKSANPVGIFLNRRLKTIHTVTLYMPKVWKNQHVGWKITQWLASNPNVKLFIITPENIKLNKDFILENIPNNVITYVSGGLQAVHDQISDLILMNLSDWEYFVKLQDPLLRELPSTLLLHNK
jgi:Kef-type K+ transport system membrane component KefB